jgi:hypothetical protein
LCDNKRKKEEEKMPSPSYLFLHPFSFPSKC